MAAKKKKKASASPRGAAKKKTRRVAAKAPLKAKKPSVKRAKAKASGKSAAKKKTARKASPKRRVAAKPASKPKARSAKAKPARAKPIARRDGAGHLDPKYASDLRALVKPHEDDTAAFLGGNRSSDDLAQELGEEVIGTATSGEYEAEDALNQSVPEERGGPFVPSTAGAEFAREDTDESNPTGATREPFPTT